MRKVAAFSLVSLLVFGIATAEEKPVWQQEVEASEKANPSQHSDDPNQIYYSDKPPAATPLTTPAQAPVDEPPMEKIPSSEPAPKPAADETPRLPAENAANPEATTEETLPAPEPEPAKWAEASKGSVKVLNKVYTRNKQLNLKKGEEVKLGALQIKLEKCFRVPDSDKKESSALLLISETFKSQPTKVIFHGWMFSASPAISALEHPLYDVILLGCEDEQKEVKKEENETPKKK